MIKEIEVGGVRHSIQSENTIKVTWEELKTLRDEAKLNAGTFYRITDYVTTTTQLETKSANHPFDVIVLALSENTLSEDAKAALHEGDTYFADSDLSAWELKYCLDNDSQRFSWADETNGKGVIYRMIDEKRNDCPYDFKNILFSGYYTFTYYGDVDASIAKSSRVQYNTIHCSGSSIRKVIFQIPLLASCRNNSVGAFSSGTFIDASEYNTIGEHCSFKITHSSNNIIENECYEIDIEDFGHNIIKSHNKYLRVKSYQSVVEEHFNDKDYMINILKHGTTYTNSVQCGENFHDDGSGQVVPIKHPDLSTQPSILPYKFMGQYVYEQLIPNITLGALINSETYFSPNLGLAVKESPYVISANAIIKTDFGVLTVPITTYIEYTVIQFKLDVATISGDFGGLGDSLLCQIHIIYTSMPEGDSSYYGYNNYGGGGNIEDFSNAVVIRLAGNYSAGVYDVYFIGVEAERINDTTYVYKNLSSVSKDDAPTILIVHPSGNVTQPISVKIYHDGVELDSTKVEIRNDGVITFTTPLPIYTYNTVEAIINI